VVTDQTLQRGKAHLTVEAGKTGGGESVGDLSSNPVPEERHGIEEGKKARPDC